MLLSTINVFGFCLTKGLCPQATYIFFLSLSKNSSYLKSLQNLLRAFGLGVRPGCQHRHCIWSDGFAWRPSACCRIALWDTGASDGGLNRGSELGRGQRLLPQVFHGAGVIREGGHVWLCRMASFQDFWHLQAFEDSLTDGEPLDVLLEDPLCLLLRPCVLVSLM